MFKKLKNKKAQMTAAEYTILIFLVVGVVMTMGVYFKRAVQARYRGARRLMFSMIKSRADSKVDYLREEIYRAEYEPYYLNVTTYMDKTLSSDSRLLPGGTTGVFRKIIDDTTTSVTTSETAPPKDVFWD